MLRVIATWFSLAGLYLLLAAKVNWPEACVAGLAATAGCELVRRLRKLQGDARQHMPNAPHASSARQAWSTLPPAGWLAQILASVWTDGWRVMAALVRAAWGRRRLHGSLDLVGFAADGDNAAHAARRTWVTLGLSLAPATAVIVFDRGRRRLLVHRLPPAGKQTVPEPTGAAPESLTRQRLTEAYLSADRSAGSSDEWPT